MVAVRASQERTVGHYKATWCHGFQFFFGDFTALCENVQSPRAHSSRRLIAGTCDRGIKSVGICFHIFSPRLNENVANMGLLPSTSPGQPLPSTRKKL